MIVVRIQPGRCANVPGAFGDAVGRRLSGNLVRRHSVQAFQAAVHTQDGFEAGSKEGIESPLPPRPWSGFFDHGLRASTPSKNTATAVNNSNRGRRRCGLEIAL